MTGSAHMPHVEVSVLVPAKDEAENLPIFLELCEAAFRDRPEQYEVVVVDDGSRDATPVVLAELQQRYPFLRTVRHRSQRGIADAFGALLQRRQFHHAAFIEQTHGGGDQ